MRSLMVSLPLALWAGSSLAEVTADQLWQGFRDAMAAEGVAVTAQESRRGNALILRGGQIDAGDGAVVLLPDVTLTETPDGAVTVTLPQRFPLTLDLPPMPGDPDKLTLDVSAPGLALTFRDLTAEVLDFDLAAQSVTATLEPFVTTPGGTDGPSDVFLALAVADLAFSHSHRVAKPDVDVTSSLSLGTFHAEMRIDVPAEDLKASLAADLGQVTGRLKALIPPGTKQLTDRIDKGSDPDLAVLLELLDAGSMLDAGFTHGTVSFSFDANEAAGRPSALAMSVGNGATTVTLDRSGLLYDVLTGPSRVFYRGTDPEIPVPEFEATLDEYRTMLRLGFPGSGTWGSGAGQANTGQAAAKPDAGEWGLIYRIAGVALSPGLWDLADPGRILPRDPFTLSLDVAGGYALDPAALAPNWAPTPDSPPPFREITLALREVVLAGVGASMTGQGDVAVDFTQMVTVNDIPQASGKLGFVTLGANGLIERLNKLGLLSADELQAARLGLLFLGRLEGGEDRLVSSVEFDGKAVSLNGQRIR